MIVAGFALSAESLHNHLPGSPNGRKKNGAQEVGIGCDVLIYIQTCRYFHMNKTVVLTRATYAVPG